MFAVTFVDYGCPDFGQQEYYEVEKLFSSWSAAEKFIRSLEDFEFCSAVYHFRDRKSTRLNTSHVSESRMPSSA